MYKTVDEIPLGLRDIIRSMSVRSGKDYTEEQQLLMSNFHEDVICFADAGTGKTETAISGIVVANLFHKIPADKITVMSFTRQATTELKVRFQKMCSLLNIRSKVSFRTLDSMCLDIIMANYEELDMEAVSSREQLSVEQLSEFLLEYAAEKGINLGPQKVRSVVHAIRNLNNGLVFDREHVETKASFKRTKLTYEDFETLRSGVYNLNKVLDRIPLGDISLYTLEILTRNPEISKYYKEQNRLMIVDEFQDMSLLKLRLVSQLCQKLVVIGDMKQQIYAFNGASSKIVEHYKQTYPNHVEMFLSQSWRCDNEIVEYSKKSIAPNKMKEEKFKGVDRQGKVIVHSEPFNMKEFAHTIGEEYRANNNVFEESYMFLFRNNQSAIPIVEALYKEKVPCIVNKYTPAHQIPVIKDLVALTELARHPEKPDNVEIISKVLPEFSKFPELKDNPIYKIMRKEGLDFFQIHYNYRDGYRGELLHAALLKAREKYNEGAKTSEIFNALYPAYNELYLRNRGMYLENEPEYYLRLVRNLVQTKGFQQFLSEEMAKVEYIKEWAMIGEGIRCFTFHASKGTEADIVHILDADEGIVPNLNKIQETIDSGAVMDAAREIRNERSLVFVAITRAKRLLHVHHTKDLSSLFTGDNKFAGLDAHYEHSKEEYDDVGAFVKFFNL